MNRRLPLFARTLAFGLFVAATSGCVDRHFVIDSDPPGANVYMNDKLIGATPLYQSFDYYGTYRFVFVRDGYEWTTVDEKVRAPWYEYFPIEFFAENVVPTTIRDVHFVGASLRPRQEVPVDAILQRAQEVQSQGRAIMGPPVPIQR